MTLVKDGRADFIQDDPDRYRDHCSGILQRGREIGFKSNFKHYIGK